MLNKLNSATFHSFTRSPRYIVVTIFGVTLTALLFVWNQPHALGRLGAKLNNYYTPHDPLYGNLQATLEYQENVYQEMIVRRKGLIDKWGGNITALQAFPDTGAFYTVWDFVIPAFSCPFPVTRVGTLGDGGKWICGFHRVIKQKECVIYSFGVEQESSFEAEILTASKSCRIWGYDFSVSEFGPQLRDNPDFASRVEFNPFRLGGQDLPDAFPQQHTLQGLMAMNGHNFIDILKVDIEGSEFDVLGALLDAYKGRPLPFGQLQIEIHLWGKNFESFLTWWERLEEAGLRPFWTEPNLPSINYLHGAPAVLEWSFINTRGRHILINDY